MTTQVVAENGRQSNFKVGIIGGTGLEDPDIMQVGVQLDIDTPFGRPSDTLIEGVVAGVPCVLLSRHGRRHHLSPTNINYRANIWALKKAGVGVIIASSACGSLREELPPGTVVMLDSFIDRTTKREQTFYDDVRGHPRGICHIPMHPAFNEPLRHCLLSVVRSLGMPHQSHGTLVCVEGPRFSTRAESTLFRQWGAHCVGMTLCPEAVLAKELGVPYASVAIVTDYDCWRDATETVSIGMVAETMHNNAARLKRMFVEAVKAIAKCETQFRAEAHKAKELAIASVMDAGKEMDFDHLS